MADTIVLTLDTPKAYRLGSGPFGLVMGSANLSSYSSAKVPLTALTNLFMPSGLLRVCPNGTSSGAYHVRWSAADSAFKAYYGGVAGAPVLAAAGAAAAIGSPPASTVAYTNADAFPEDIIITGGTSTHVTITRANGSFTSADIATTGPIRVHLEVGDAMTVTYSVAGTWTKLPYAVYGAAVGGAGTEVANATNVGTFDFIAMGQMG